MEGRGRCGASGKYLASLLLFGLNGIVASQIALPSGQIVWLRTGLGSLLLMGALVLGRRWGFLRWRRELGAIALSGMALGVSWIFLYEAYQRIGVSLASLLYYCGPVIVMALSPVLFRERITGRKAAGFAAVLPLVWFAALRAHSIQHGWFTWRALGLTLFAGLAFVYYACDPRAALRRLKQKGKRI